MQIKSLTSEQPKIWERHSADCKLDEIPDSGRESAVVVRYDGAMAAKGREVVFAVVSTEDLAKLPADLLQGMNMLETSDEGALVGSRAAFFAEHPAHGTCLYVDTERHESFLVRARQACEADGLGFIPVKGDLLALEDGRGFITPPAKSAAQKNGFPAVSTRDGLDEVRERRAMIEARHPAEIGEIPDGPSC